MSAPGTPKNTSEQKQEYKREPLPGLDSLDEFATNSASRYERIKENHQYMRDLVKTYKQSQIEQHKKEIKRLINILKKENREDKNPRIEFFGKKHINPINNEALAILNKIDLEKIDTVINAIDILIDLCVKHSALITGTILESINALRDIVAEKMMNTMIDNFALTSDKLPDDWFSTVQNLQTKIVPYKYFIDAINSKLEYLISKDSPNEQRYEELGKDFGKLILPENSERSSVQEKIQALFETVIFDLKPPKIEHKESKSHQLLDAKEISDLAQTCVINLLNEYFHQNDFTQEKILDGAVAEFDDYLGELNEADYSSKQIREFRDTLYSELDRQTTILIETIANIEPGNDNTAYGDSEKQKLLKDQLNALLKQAEECLKKYNQPTEQSQQRLTL